MKTTQPIKSFELMDLMIFLTMIAISLAFSIIYLFPSQTQSAFLDTANLIDTMFVLGSAWRSNQGLTPAADFGYFYGGHLEDGMALAMDVFGHTAFVFEYFAFFVALALNVVFYILFRSRMSLSGLGVLILTTTVLLLTRQPLEYLPVSTGPVSTHSFLYNRFGLAAFVGAGMFVALPSRRGRAEVIGGALIGSVVALALLIKPTFAILLVGTFIGLLIQSRKHAIIGLLSGVVATVLVCDPDLARWRGAIAYSAAQVGEERGAQLGYLVMRAIRIPLAQPLAMILSIGAIAYVSQAKASRRALFSVIIVALAGLGMTVTMGGAPGQLALPIAILLALAAAEWAHATGLDFRTPLKGIALAIPVSFAVLHGVNLAGATLLGRQKADLSLIKTGPYERYVGVQSQNSGAGRLTHYEMFADGIAELNRIGDPRGWGIVADMGITFEYAVLAKPVAGYPLWQRKTAPEFAPGRPLPPGVDVVMIGRKAHAASLRDVLTAKMASDFRACRTSEYWDIFVRKTLGGVTCNRPAADEA